MVATRSPELLARIEDKTLVMEPEMRRRMRERWDKGAINGVGTSPSDADVTTKLFPAERVTSFKYRGSLGRAPGGKLGSRVVTVRGVRPSTSERRGERRRGGISAKMNAPWMWHCSAKAMSGNARKSVDTLCETNKRCYQ